MPVKSVSAEVINMHLLVDIGNTRIKWGLWQTSRLIEQHAFSWQSETFATQLDTQWKNINAVSVTVCSVASDEINQSIADWCHQQPLKPTFAYSRPSQAGLVCAYENPERLGCDRWIAMLGARSINKGAVCVIDCGTAVTVDLVAADGQHVGGCIFPGLMTMRESLGRRAHRLEKVTGRSTAFSTNTEDAISGGTIYAIVGAIDKFIDMAKKETGSPITCLLTGGDAMELQPFLQSDTQLIPALVLLGLAEYVQLS